MERLGSFSFGFSTQCWRDVVFPFDTPHQVLCSLDLFLVVALALVASELGIHIYTPNVVIIVILMDVYQRRLQPLFVNQNFIDFACCVVY